LSLETKARVLNDIVFWVIFSLNLMVVFLITVTKAVRLKFAIVFASILQTRTRFLLRKRPFLSLETESRVLNDVIFWVVFSLNLMVVFLITITKAIRLKFAIVFTFVLHNSSGMLLSERPVLSLETKSSVLNNIIFWITCSLNFMVIFLITVSKAV
jgi:hypothetical protein